MAKSVANVKKVAKLSKIGIATLTAALTTALATAPATGGLSLAAAAPVAAMTGLEAGVIISVAAIGGVVIVLAIYQGYNVKVSAKDKTGKAVELELHKK